VIGDDAVRPMADQPAATAGGPGPEPCRDCRAPLVPGQRYCLYCGARVPAARLEFMDVLVQDVAGVGPAPAGVGAVAAGAAASAGFAPVASAAREPGVNGWLRQHAPVLGLTGLILGTLLIGLLIGHWATSSSDRTPVGAAKPQVIRVESAAPAAASAGATSGAATSAGASSAGGGKASGSGAGSGAGAKAKAGASSSSAAKSAAVKKTTAKAPANAVNTDNLSGQAKQKAIEKAAKKGQPIATGNGSGKLPPTDDKAPAGGTGFETIG
jgi:hypothetical protein